MDLDLDVRKDTQGTEKEDENGCSCRQAVGGSWKGGGLTSGFFVGFLFFFSVRRSTEALAVGQRFQLNKGIACK